MTFECESASTIAIIKENIAKLATYHRVNIDESLDLKDECIASFLSLVSVFVCVYVFVYIDMYLCMDVFYNVKDFLYVQYDIYIYIDVFYNVKDFLYVQYDIYIYIDVFYNVKDFLYVQYYIYSISIYISSISYTIYS